MADAAVASGLMPHQKDEHDIWTCKDCGWKYPNAKPSPKIRKNHKKHCPGKAGVQAHAPGGSSDEASDDDHHHHSVKGSTAPKETAVEAPVPQVESKSRDFDFSSASLNSSTAPAETGNGNAKETPAHEEPPAPAPAPAPAPTPAPAAVPVEASHGGLMPHQKDEHDIWICKECGWKYPNAKPSSKVRKNHKKHCPGKGGPVAAGGSSDEASDDEHHHHAVPTPAAAVEPAQQESELTASAAPAEAEAPSSVSREIDFAALKESSTPAINDETPAADLEEDAGKGTGDATVASPPESEPVGLEKAVPDEAEVSKTPAPEAAVASELMPHQKDAHDVWTCKDCGWKYPNAKPSPKIRKHHKKKCTGKASGAAAAAAGGSSDEASDDEHHHVPSPLPSVPEALPPAVEAEETAAAPEVPGNISRDIDFAALKESTNPAEENETTSASTAETTPAVAEAEALEEQPGKSTSAEGAGAGAVVGAGAAAGALSLKEAIDKDSGKQEAPKKTLSLQEAIDKESEKEKELTASTKSTEPTVGSDGLMAHQKDESDVWVCKDCGWKYPNAKPSPKIKRNHKKKCPGKAGSGAPVGSSDEATDDEHHATAEKGSAKDEKPSTPAAETVPEVPDAQIKSREFSFSSAFPKSDAAPAGETGEAPDHPAENEEPPAKVAEAQQTVGGLMANQKDERDVWQCKECGWKYPNAKPSAKVRKNHKKKCPKKGGAAKGTDGGSSDWASSGDDNLKAPKCFPCL